MSWRTETFVVWGALLAAFFACEIVAKVAPRRWPSVGSLLQRVEARTAWRTVALLVWMWLGWHTFAR